MLCCLHSSGVPPFSVWRSPLLPSKSYGAGQIGLRKKNERDRGREGGEGGRKFGRERGGGHTDRQVDRMTDSTRKRHADRQTDREKGNQRWHEMKQSNGEPVNGPVPPGGSLLSLVITCQGFITAPARSCTELASSSSKEGNLHLNRRLSNMDVHLDIFVIQKCLRSK